MGAWAKESSEAEYHNDQVYWQHKAAVKAAAEERLRMSLYKSPGKVPTYREEVQETEGERTQLKAAAKRAEAAAETCFQEEQLRRLNASPEVERPWAVASLSISPQAADSARRRQHAEGAKLNRSLFTEGAIRRIQELEKEKAAIRCAALQEDNFFNRGASSEKWIAPEHRVRCVNVAALCASSMPWMAPEQAAATPRAVREPNSARYQGVHRSSSSGFGRSCFTPSQVKEVTPVRHQRDTDTTRVHSRPLWAWDAEPVQRSRK